VKRIDNYAEKVSTDGQPARADRCIRATLDRRVFPVAEIRGNSRFGVSWSLLLIISAYRVGGVEIQVRPESTRDYIAMGVDIQAGFGTPLRSRDCSFVA